MRLELSETSKNHIVNTHSSRPECLFVSTVKEFCFRSHVRNIWACLITWTVTQTFKSWIFVRKKRECWNFVVVPFNKPLQTILNKSYTVSVICTIFELSFDTNLRTREWFSCPPPRLFGNETTPLLYEILKLNNVLMKRLRTCERIIEFLSSPDRFQWMMPFDTYEFFTVNCLTVLSIC